MVAGLVVGVVALPLSMALAIATGVAPQHGLYTAIVAGAVIAALGGSRTQVSGPTAAFVVVLVPIVARFGIGGLLLATAMAGAILCLLGFARMGRLIQFIPFPVVTGFTAGIAVVIAVGQLPDLLGLTLSHRPETLAERLALTAAALPAARPAEAAVAAATLLLLIGLPRLLPRVPGPLAALGAVSLATAGLTALWPGLEIATIGGRFAHLVDGHSTAGIPSAPPPWTPPWLMPGPDGAPLGLSWPLVRSLLPSALAIALLGAIESLLSAVAADAMAGTRHDPDAELLAQGTGNLIAPFFGGFAATGAIARTATNVRAGGRSPVAAITHAAFLLAATVGCAPLFDHLPMAAMAALLLVVAWRMSDARHVVAVVRRAPRGDVLVLLACLVLTVVFDMIVAVVVGITLAALLFMRRMSELSDVELVARGEDGAEPELPPGVLCYRVAGPLFFGAARKAIDTLRDIGRQARVVVLDMRDVPAIDGTGLANLGSAFERLAADGVPIVLVGVRTQPGRVLQRAGLLADSALVRQSDSWVAGIALAAALARPPG